MNVYFDNNCWGRRHDDHQQARMKREMLAVEVIINTCKTRGHCIVGSWAVDFEILENPKVAVRDDIMAFYRKTIDRHIRRSTPILARAMSFQAAGLKAMDSFHLATAEYAGVDLLITGDDTFEKISTKKRLSRVIVINPLALLLEALL